MEALLYWLRIGIAALVAFLPPAASFDGEGFAVRLETRSLLTDQMKDLVTHGLVITFELRASLKVSGRGGEEDRFFAASTRSVRFDYLSDRYVLEDSLATAYFPDIESLEKAAKAFPPLRFPLPAHWQKLSLFARLRIVDDEVLSNRLGIPAGELWRGYAPSLLRDWRSGD